MSDHVNRFGAKAASALMGLCAIGVLIMMLAIVVQVLASRAGVTTVSALSTPWPLFRDEITLNSLTDLQWYLLAAIALLPAGVVWLRSEHVRVDFIYSQLKRYLARGGSTCRSKPATSGDRVRVLLPDSTMALSQWLSMALPRLLLSRVFSNVLSNWLLVAVPMFIFMGYVLEKSGVAAPPP